MITSDLTEEQLNAKLAEIDYRSYINWHNISCYEFTLGSCEKTNLFSIKVWALPYRKEVGLHSELGVCQVMAATKEEAVAKFKDEFGYKE